VADRVLFIFAKEPRPGQVKTRMCPPLAAEQAARCQRAFLADLVERLRSLGGVRIVLVAAPEGDAPWLERFAVERSLALAWQGPGDLGQRMQRLLERAVANGERALIVGCDSPDLPLAYVLSAFDSLSRPGVAIGPAADGGYYLVGSFGVVPPIFTGIAWGGPEVLACTLARLEAAAVEFTVLPSWHDVDDFGGLRRLARQLRAAERGGADHGLPACARVVGELSDEGVAL